MKILQLALIVFLLCGAGLCAGAYSVWHELTEPIMVDSRVLVQIPPGFSTDQAMTRLEQAGIIKHRLPLRLYIKLTGASPRIKAGDYYFPSPISPMDVLQKLEEGGQGADKITVIEGWNRWDIADAMARIPSLKLKNADEALKLLNNPAAIKDLDPDATSLEGYLFPDTYFVYTTSTAQDLVDAMVKRFRDLWQSKLAAAAKQSNMTAHNLVTVASIIETEAKLRDERPVVASVIYNRLTQKMPLAVDSTIVYASKLAGKWKGDGKVYLSDVNRDSPYNTRKVKGLPPGPVGSPGLPSLEAALAPANTGYLYYVRNPARDDGAHNFYVSSADFDKGVLALRAWEAKQKHR